MNGFRVPRPVRPPRVQLSRSRAAPRPSSPPTNRPAPSTPRESPFSPRSRASSAPGKSRSRGRPHRVRRPAPPRRRAAQATPVASAPRCARSDAHRVPARRGNAERVISSTPPARRCSRCSGSSTSTSASPARRRLSRPARHLDTEKRALEAKLAALTAAPPPPPRKRKDRACRAPLPRVPGRQRRRIWVGKGAADNDTLSFKLGRPHHLWLHAAASRERTSDPAREGIFRSARALLDAACLALHTASSRASPEARSATCRSSTFERSAESPAPSPLQEKTFPACPAGSPAATARLRAVARGERAASDIRGLIRLAGCARAAPFVGR